MFSRQVALFSVLVIAVNAGVLHVAAPAAYISAKTELAEEYDSHPQYSFSYSVEDGSTGDNKHQHETRDGDSVVGQYSLLEADGSRRTVDYTADAVNGFNAVVTKSAGEHPIAAPTKYIAAAPAKLLSPIVAAPAKIVSHQPIVASAAVYSAPAPVYHAPQQYSIVQRPAVAYHHAPVVSHAPLVSTAYHAPLYSHDSYYHAPTHHVVSHSPLEYHQEYHHAPSAAIIHH